MCFESKLLWGKDSMYPNNCKPYCFSISGKRNPQIDVHPLELMVLLLMQKRRTFLQHRNLNACLQLSHHEQKHLIKTRYISSKSKPLLLSSIAGSVATNKCFIAHVCPWKLNHQPEVYHVLINNANNDKILSHPRTFKNYSSPHLPHVYFKGCSHTYSQLPCLPLGVALCLPLLRGEFAHRCIK